MRATTKPGWARPLPPCDAKKTFERLKTAGPLRETEVLEELDFEHLRPHLFEDELVEAAVLGGEAKYALIEKLEEAGLCEPHIWDMLRAGDEIATRREKKAAASAAWSSYPESPAMRVALHNGRDARHTGKARGTLTVRQWEAICWCWGYRCAYCTDRPATLTIEHVRPVCEGGRTELGNIVPSCGICNRSKRARSAQDWLGDGYDDFKTRLDAANETAAILSVEQPEEGAA